MPRKKKNTVAKPIPVAVLPPVATARPSVLAESAKRYAMLLVGSLREFFTRLQRQRQERFLRVVDSVSLGDKRLVVVVQAGDERYLIGAAGASMTLLSSLHGSGAQPGKFATLLQQAETQRMTIN